MDTEVAFWRAVDNLRVQTRAGALIQQGPTGVLDHDIMREIVIAVALSYQDDGFARWSALHDLSLASRGMYHVVDDAMAALNIPCATTVDVMRHVYGTTRGRAYETRFLHNLRPLFREAKGKNPPLEESEAPIVSFARALSKLPPGLHIVPANYLPTLNNPTDIGGGCNSASYALAAASNVLHFAVLTTNRNTRRCTIPFCYFPIERYATPEQHVDDIAADGKFVVSFTIVCTALTLGMYKAPYLPMHALGVTCDYLPHGPTLSTDYATSVRGSVHGQVGRCAVSLTSNTTTTCPDWLGDFAFLIGRESSINYNHVDKSYPVLPIERVKQWLREVPLVEKLIRNSTDPVAKDLLRAEYEKRPEFTALVTRVADLETENKRLKTELDAIQESHAAMTRKYAARKNAMKRANDLLDHVVYLQRSNVDPSYSTTGVHGVHGVHMAPLPSPPSTQPWPAPSASALPSVLRTSKATRATRATTRGSVGRGGKRKRADNNNDDAE